MTEGFADATTETLRVIRANLLRGLDLVADHIQAGTLHDLAGKSSTPAEGGHLTLALLNGLDVELSRRMEKAS